MKKWKAGIALLLALAVTGCGNAANNAGNAAGNAAGWAGNTVGNVVRGTGNVIGQAGNAVGNAAGQAGNAAGNAIRSGTNRATDWSGGPNSRGGTQSVQFHPTTRTVDIRLSGAPMRANARGGVVAGDVRGAGVPANWSTASTITVPVGWKVRVTGPAGATWANNVYVVPYRGAGWTRTGGTLAPGAPNTTLANGRTFTAAQPGHYAILVSGNGYTNHVVDFVNVTNQTTSPSIVTNHAW
jgi:hypothetical protein